MRSQIIWMTLIVLFFPISCGLILVLYSSHLTSLSMWAFFPPIPFCLALNSCPQALTFVAKNGMALSLLTLACWREGYGS